MDKSLPFAGSVLLTIIVAVLYARTVKQQAAEGQKASFLPIVSGFWCAVLMVLGFSDTILFSYVLAGLTGHH
jgi:hypothetical protein